MKKLFLLFTLICFLLSCSKSNDSSSTSNSNGGSGNNTAFHDSTLLFALNVTSTGFNDTSIYKNATIVSNSTSKDTLINGNYYVSYGNANTLPHAQNQEKLPTFFGNLPLNKIQNNVTIYFEIMNSKYSLNNDFDSTGFDIIGNLGTPNPSNTDTKNPINFNLSYNKSEWSRRIDWKSVSSPCIVLPPYDYIEFYTSNGQLHGTLSGSSVIPNKPLNTTKTQKFVINFNQNIVSSYLDGQLLDNHISTVNISLNGCSQFIPGITLTTLRGTLIKNVKVWNRSLSALEINQL